LKKIEQQRKRSSSPSLLDAFPLARFSYKRSQSSLENVPERSTPPNKEKKKGKTQVLLSEEKKKKTAP